MKSKVNINFLSRHSYPRDKHNKEAKTLFSNKDSFVKKHSKEDQKMRYRHSSKGKQPKELDDRTLSLPSKQNSVSTMLKKESSKFTL